jgi:hypothetical protein
LNKLDKETSDALATKVGKNIRSAQRSGGVSTEQIAADTSDLGRRPPGGLGERTYKTSRGHRKSGGTRR